MEVSFILSIFQAYLTIFNRWCYWMNVVCAGLSIVLLVLCYFPPNFHELQQNMTKMQELQRIDYGGLSLYSAGLILILLGFCKLDSVNFDAQLIIVLKHGLPVPIPGRVLRLYLV